MTETSMEARFKELEAKHEAFKKKVKIGGLLLLIMFTGLILLGAVYQSGQVLSISKIIVPSDGLEFVSPGGDVIGAMYPTDYGGAFAICNNKDRFVGTMSATENGGILGLWNNQGKTTWNAP